MTMETRQYMGHLPKGLRDFSKPNFNLAARKMDKALINASLEEQGGMVTNTHRARVPAIKKFIQFIEETTSVKRLNHINKQHVRSFGECLKNSAEEGLISPATARDYLSHVNRALAQARGDERCVVNATRDLDFTPKSGIATVDQSVSEALHQKVLAKVSTEVGLVMELQRAFGFRFREGALFDASRVLKEIQQDKVPMLNLGTKGGQARALPEITDEKYQLLLRVEQFQKLVGHDSLIPPDQSFKAFQSEAWRQTKQADENYLSHGERKYWACDTYFQEMGVRCPVQACVAHGKAHYQYIANTLNISEAEAKKRDHAVRLRISKLLGHHRVTITNIYLG
ncbi:integrase domain-containing protein [Vibrio sp. DNB22_12_1]